MSIISNNTLKAYGGDVAIGAMTVINAVMILFLMSAMGITQGAQPIIGFNYGAGNRERVKKTVALELFSISIICLITFFAIQTSSERLAGIFTSDPALIRISGEGMRIFLMMLPVISTQIVGASYFQAVGKAKKATLLGLMRQVILLIPLLLILPHFWGLNGVWAAGAVADFIAFCVASRLLLKEMALLK